MKSLLMNDFYLTMPDMYPYCCLQKIKINTICGDLHIKISQKVFK